MAGNRLPWFKFHRGDYLRATVGWPPIARLCYFELLAAQWDLGHLPVDQDELRALVPGLTARQWSTAWPHVDRAFPIVADAYRLNVEHDKLRANSERVNASRSDAARKAAKARWQDRTGVSADRETE